MACGLGCERIRDAYYLEKLHRGLLCDSERRYHARQPARPELQVVSEDRWVNLTADLLTQLLALDAATEGRRELSAGDDLSFLR